MKLTEDEQDAMAANCGMCWSCPQKPCRIVHKDHSLGKERRPHKMRIQRAARRGLMGGVGRMLLAQNRKVDG